MNATPLNPATWFHGREEGRAWSLTGQRGLLAKIAIAGYVAGFSVLPNEWLHLGWLACAGCFAFGWSERSSMLQRRRMNAGTWLITAFLLWMTLRSCLGDTVRQGHAVTEVMRGLCGTALLALFCAVLWPLARDRRLLGHLAWINACAAGFAAFTSLGLCTFILPEHQPGERLQNLLVHGGLNPVCTGLIFGFAALWLAAEMENTPSVSRRHAMWGFVAFLHLAAFLSGSRGAMLALSAGHVALFAARGWRRGIAALAVLVLSGAIYFSSAPVFSHIASWHAEKGAAPVSTVGHPLQQAIERGDSRRIDIYHAGWTAIDDVWSGTGQWGIREVWQCELQPGADSAITCHLHSAFFATFVHGGIIGTLLLLALLVLAFRRAWRVSTQGDAVWLALLAFGCGGLLFDGESLTSLATAPRFEGLLFWLPLTVALARGGLNSRSAGSGNPPLHRTRSN